MTNSYNVGDRVEIILHRIVDKDGTNITFEDPNFEIPQDYTSKEIAKVENNKITLNQIKNGETVELAIPVNFKENNLCLQCF